MNRFAFSTCIELSKFRVYLTGKYEPLDIDIDILDKVFRHHVETTLDKDQCRSRCLDLVETYRHDLEHQKADRLLEIGVMIEAVISNNEVLKIQDWAARL